MASTSTSTSTSLQKADRAFENWLERTKIGMLKALLAEQDKSVQTLVRTAWISGYLAAKSESAGSE